MSAVIALVITAFLSDRAKSRSMYVIIPLVIGGIGLVTVISIPKGVYPGALYAMLFFVAIGLYSMICGSVAWTGKLVKLLQSFKLNPSKGANLQNLHSE